MKWRVMAMAAVGLAALAAAGPARGQTSDEIQSLRKEIDALKQGQGAILQELKGLRDALQQGRPAARPAAPPAPPENLLVSVEGAVFKGKADAKVTLVDFTDYQ